MSEQTEAKRDGARLQKNSGRGQLAKGDARLGEFIVDYKEAGTTFGLSKSVWAKVCTDAMKHRARPLLKLILGKGVNVRLAVLEWSYFEELHRKAGKYDEIEYEKNYGI